MLKVPWRAIDADQFGEGGAQRAAGRAACRRSGARNSCSRKQKARSLSVLPTGRKAPSSGGSKLLEVAVVGEHPVAAPQFAHKRMAVLERDMALRGLADVGDDVGRLDRIVLDQFGDRRGDGGLVVDEMAHAGALEKGDAPAIVVGIGAAAAVGETGEAENTMSVGTLQFIARSWHMAGSLPCRRTGG